MTDIFYKIGTSQSPACEKKCLSLKPEAGFSLTEMALATLIVGLILVIGTAALNFMAVHKFEKNTYKRLQLVADAVSLYAQKNMRVPCPADPTNAGPEPFGTEENSGVAGTLTGDCALINGGRREGIVPFATLGLPADSAKDAWGKFFTYRVSPSAVIDAANIPPGLEAGLWCQTQPVWHDGTQLINHAKSAFCCGVWDPPHNRPDLDIQIMGPHGELPTVSRRAADFGGTDPEYDQPDATSSTAAELADTFSPVYPAFILISHGENGIGAFSNAGIRSAGTFLSAEEEENADDDLVYYATDRNSPVPPSDSGGVDLYRNQIDDNVFWQSQAQVMSRLGDMSCARP